MSISRERYFHTPGRFAGRVGGTASSTSARRGSTGSMIGVTKGSAHEAYLRTFFRDSRIVVFENPELRARGVAAGEGSR